MKLVLTFGILALSTVCSAGATHEYRVDGVLDVATLRATDGLVGHLLLVDNDSGKELLNLHFQCAGSGPNSNDIKGCPVSIQKTFRSQADYMNLSLVIIDEGNFHFLWSYTRADIATLTVSNNSPISSMHTFSYIFDSLRGLTRRETGSDVTVVYK